MYKHCKAIAATGEGVEIIRASSIPLPDMKVNDRSADPALIVEEKSEARRISATFIKAIAQHRNWDREKLVKDTIPA